MHKIYVWWYFCFILADRILLSDAAVPSWTKPSSDTTFSLDRSNLNSDCVIITELKASSTTGQTVKYSVPDGGSFAIGDDLISGNKKLTCTGKEDTLTESSYTVTVKAFHQDTPIETADRILTITILSDTDCTADPESADNAQISKTNDNKAGSVATYSCDEGYTRTAGDATRTCTDGSWAGTAPTCSTDNNILQRLKDNIKTSMSSVVNNWTSDRAADGNIGPDPDMCQCCSGTENSRLSWWMVDIGANIPINRIIVYSRSNEKDYRQLEGFQLSLSDNIIYNVTSFTSTSTQMFSIMYELQLPDILTQYIKIQRPGSLTLCEIKVFQGVCELGSFGHECEQRCHCADNRQCDVDTGYCQFPACKTGWQGQACNEKCPQDAFGEECSGKCYCADGTCTHNYGTCPGKCRTGYRGPHCNEECPQDSFGEECSGKCYCAEKTCTHDNGTCPGQCRIGYRGLHCNEAEESEMENKSLIIGEAVGVPVALIVVAVIIGVVVYRARHKNRSSGTNEPDVYITPIETQEYDTLDDVNDVRGSEATAM